MEQTTQQVRVSGEQQQQRQPPVQRFTAGEVQVAVWKNTTVTGEVIHKATVGRRYRDQTGAWRSTGSFRKDELADLIAALERAVEEMPA